LSLPGRISVIKNLLVPQINYLGCFLNPAPNVLVSIQESLDTFALEGFRYPRNVDIYPVKTGDWDSLT
jgi:hypothetical protein